MKNSKTAINLCMGSSCYARGNDQILDVIKSFIDDEDLKDRVDFRGHLCQGHCNKGPNLTISKKEYHNVSLSSIRMILDDTLKKTL